MKLKQLLFLLFFFSLLTMPALASKSNQPPVAVQTSDPSQNWFFESESVVFSSSSYDPDGYIAERKWYINGVYQSASTTLSRCFVLFGTTGTSCYQLGSGATSVSIKLEVKDNAGEWRSSTVSYTIRAEKARRYFVTDHLGSVRTTVDRDGNVLGHDDYYPFGLAMPGRSVNTANPDDNYKFTGYEEEDEGGLNLYHAGNRLFDPVLGRFMQIDRYYSKYPSMSTYQYAANNPIYFIDVNGDSIWVNQGKNSYLYVDGTLYNKDGTEYTGKIRGFLKQTVDALNKIREGGEAGEELISSLQNAEEHINIFKGTDNKAAKDGSTNNVDVFWNPSDRDSGFDENGDRSRPSFIGLAHELAHADDFREGAANVRTRRWDIGLGTQNPRLHEQDALHWENRIRAENGIPLRVAYGVYNNKPIGRVLIPGTRMSAFPLTTVTIGGRTFPHYPIYK